MHFGHVWRQFGIQFVLNRVRAHHHLQGERVFNVEASVEGIPLSRASCSSVLVSARFVLMCRFFHSPEFFHEHFELQCR